MLEFVYGRLDMAFDGLGTMSTPESPHALRSATDGAPTVCGSQRVKA